MLPSSGKQPQRTCGGKIDLHSTWII